MQRLLSAGASLQTASDGRNAVHVAAALDPTGPLDLLLGTLPPGQRLAALQSRDPWGRTPLYIAVDQPNAAGPLQRLLATLPAGNIPGPLGMPPMLCAYVNHRYPVAAQLAQAGGTLELAGLDEAGYRCWLAHLFGLRGSTALGPVNLSFSGGWPEAEHVLWGRGLRAIAALPALAAERSLLLWLAETFERCAERLGAPASEVLQTINSGAAVILPAASLASAGHAVSYVWYGGRLVLCNRGRLLDHPLRPCCWQLQATPLTVADVDGLQQSWGQPAAARPLQRRLQATPLHTDLAGLLASRGPWHQLPGVNNCASASAEAAMFALIAMWCADLGQLDAAPNLFDRLKTYVRWHYLCSYVRRPETLDRPLAQRCRRHLLRPWRRHRLDAADQATLRGLF